MTSPCIQVTPYCSALGALVRRADLDHGATFIRNLDLRPAPRLALARRFTASAVAR